MFNDELILLIQRTCSIAINSPSREARNDAIEELCLGLADFVRELAEDRDQADKVLELGGEL